MGSISAIRPCRWTGRIARVFGPMAALSACAGIHADTKLSAGVRRELFLELGDLGAENIATAVQHALDRSFDLGFNAGILRFEVQEGDHSGWLLLFILAVTGQLSDTFKHEPSFDGNDGIPISRCSLGL